MKKKLEREKKKGSLLRLNNFIFFNNNKKDSKMSGLIQWSSCAKRKPGKKSAGKKPNAQRQRLLASRKRKQRESALKAEAKIVWKRDAE